jgi:molybdopterin synthase sulfur carrier subunit
VSVATVRYFAGARAAAGTSAEEIEAASVAQLVETLSRREPLARVLKACSFLVDGLACREPSTPLTAASTVDVLPPFAGG